MATTEPVAMLEPTAEPGPGVIEHGAIKSDEIEPNTVALSEQDGVTDDRTADDAVGDSDRIADELRRDAVVLLSQQCWCWGQDVTRAEGNWLIEIGFERHPPPHEMKDCSSVYLLRLPEGRNLVLRGFGVFYGRSGVGGIYLPRFEFSPRFCEDSSLRSPPWADTELGHIPMPTHQNRDRCLTLLSELIDWIQQYESAVADRLGVAYREHTLAKWQNGERRTVPADEFPAAWQALATRIARFPESIFAACPEMS